MADYTNAQALADRLLAAKGFTATIRAEGTAADPVTGLGAADGATRTVSAVKARVDIGVFPESLAERSTCMLICDAIVRMGDVWVDGGTDRPVIGVMHVEPDNDSHIITKALIGG